MYRREIHKICKPWLSIIRTKANNVDPDYRKVPKFSDARKLCCNLPKIQRERPNLRILCQKDANGIANSADPDLGAV